MKYDNYGKVKPPEHHEKGGSQESINAAAKAKTKKGCAYCHRNNGETKELNWQRHVGQE